jgi:hypothetical protein
MEEQKRKNKSFSMRIKFKGFLQLDVGNDIWPNVVIWQIEQLFLIHRVKGLSVSFDDLHQ